jgi:hypothetical protein
MRILFLALIACLAFSVEAAAKNFVVSSYCPMTHVTGIGRGQTFEVAKEAAIQACLRKGGVRSCCFKFIRQLQGA